MPYSQHADNMNDGSYRGPDRRNLMADFPDFDIRLSILVIALIGAVSAAINVYFPGFLYETLQRETLYVVSIIALAIAGMLSLIRWRLDGMARSFWYGLASIVGLVPLLGIGANERTTLGLGNPSRQRPPPLHPPCHSPRHPAQPCGCSGAAPSPCRRCGSGHCRLGCSSWEACCWCA